VSIEEINQHVALAGLERVLPQFNNGATIRIAPLGLICVRDFQELLSPARRSRLQPQDGVASASLPGPFASECYRSSMLVQREQQRAG
jgi:hypothetical protein